MNSEEFFYLLPYLSSLALSLGVFVYSWRHRHVRGAKIYSWFVGGQTLTILGFILELISPNLEIKIFWDKFQWLTDSYLVILPFLIFSVEFSEYKLRYSRLVLGALVAFLGVFTIFLFTDDIHHLFYPNPHLSTAYPFPELKYDFSAIVYFYAVVYAYGANLFGISLLLRRASQTHYIQRMQYFIVAAGFSIPVVLSIFSLLNIKIAPQRDNAPFALAVGNLVVAWGLFRYGLFDIAPIARERIVENMSDPVIVLDPQNRVVDINREALTFMGKPNSEVIAHSSKDAFARWPFVVEMLDNPTEQRREVSTKSKGEIYYFDINISHILNKRQELLGRIVVARDITRHKYLEMNYRALSEELEERVQERTEELHTSAERYRAVVENQTEFIVRWKPDGTRTFVNEAYCRYFGITPEDAISTGFLSLVAEEDRRGVKEKMRRLTSGETSVETEIHRVIKPDGSIGWHEWTDQAIHDEAGKLVEFQSVGRDVTERKKAQETLRESEAIYRKAIEVAGAVPYSQSYLEEEFHISYDFIGDGIFQITGYKPEEFNEELWDSLVQESHLLGELANYSWREAVQRVRSGASPIWQCEHRIRARNGATRWVYEAAVELRDKDGKSHGSIGLYQDITQRKEAEDALRKSEDRFSKAFQASPIIITIVQINNGKLLEVNETFEKTIGYTRAESIGKTTAELALWADPQDRDRLVPIFRASGNIRNKELRFRTKNGNIITCLYSAEPIELGGERCVIAVLEDITDRKKVEEALFNQLAFDELMTRLLTRFAVCSYDQADSSIEFALKEISEFMGAEYADILISAEDKEAWNITHQWGTPNVHPGLSPTQKIPSDRLSWSAKKLRNGEPIKINTLDDYPLEATADRQFSESEGTKSLLSMPIKGLNQHVFGCIDLVSYTHQIHWSDGDVTRLQMIGDAIANLLERKNAEENLAQAYDTTLEGWAKALELRDKETEGHSRRVTEGTLIVARKMGLDEEDLVHIRRGALLHDIGKMGIPDDILRKNGPLNEEERAIVEKHPDIAYALLRDISFLEKALEIPHNHHEKWDGTGYPRGLKGNEIPLTARIFAVVDVWDALSSDRPYRNAWSNERVIEYLTNDSGKHFDPKVVNAFLELLGEGKI